ncbi:hypothetical protein RA27_01890 [Ruegeria sp. ANG-R]|uniref:TadE/TadG family type IV pilus assembly protein n=1 Tax=Ruegeria sp. ANG-R TaxID=1577903 RepID=UPI00057E1788|nr:TadE/TadG family type IV pilus assembly protein [Ruegeria sp. ANG-R]KIC42172.1 hypothetical protein RA27_01890 [Ruegeria sp. ANG-R]
MRKFDLMTHFNRICHESRCSQHLRRFVASTDGTMTILALFLIMMVFTIAGFAVDVMRYDRERVRLQYALDRAVLAAADLDQELCPRVVIDDYIRKEGFDPAIITKIVVDPETCETNEDGTIKQVEQLEGKRKVEASADMSIETHFMKWSGVDHIDTTATSIAEESIGNVEISLVLDVSGSMAGTKLTNLKEAANDFILEMIAKSEDDNISISIIPYSEQVAVPDYLMNKINTTGGNEVANCIDFQTADFSTTAFTAYSIGAESEETSPPPSVRQTLHFTENGNTDHRSSGTVVDKFNPWDPNFPCREELDKDRREMVVIENDTTVLTKLIDNMVAAGSTSINVGLKWGLALLDESTQPLINSVANDTNVPKVFKDRPRATQTTETMKVVVLMTDGKNDLQREVLPPYNDGLSDIYWNDGANKYSVLVDENNGLYKWPDIPVNEWKVVGGSWKYWQREANQDHAYGDGSTRYRRCKYWYSSGRCYNYYSEVRDEPEPGSAERLTWPDVWAYTERQAIESLLRRTKGNTYANNFRDNSVLTSNTTTKDANVVSLCTQADKKDIIIFSIAFEAPNSVKQILKDCAIKPARYYEATSGQIGRVFDSIGTSIQNLRLTQ